MRLLTFCRNDNPAPHVGVRQGTRVVDLGPGRMKDLLAGGAATLERARKATGLLLDERAIRYLPPIPDADKFLCVGKNYRQHLEELRRNELLAETPQEPTAFIKLNSCLVGHDARVARPQGIVRLDYEPELVFVIGKRALGAKHAEAFDYVAGVTILNDLTDRDAQKREVASGSRFWTGKNIPGFGPLGPEIITMDEIRDAYDLWMTCSVNGQERTRVNTRDQIWKLPVILEHFSRYIPFEPGDVVECSIDGVATLRTYIV